jgi:hypothetical protein
LAPDLEVERTREMQRAEDVTTCIEEMFLFFYEKALRKWMRICCLEVVQGLSERS